MPDNPDTAESSKPERSRGPGRRALTIALVGLTLAAAATCIKLVAFPREDHLARSDVILVLGSGDWERYRRGVELFRSGLAPHLLFSIPPQGVGMPGCGPPLHGVVAECFMPSPPTTRGESAELVRRARANGWRSAIVVTQVPHVSRARWVVNHCFAGDVAVVGAPRHIDLSEWAFNVVYQSGAWVKAYALHKFKGDACDPG